MTSYIAGTNKLRRRLVERATLNPVGPAQVVEMKRRAARWMRDFAKALEAMPDADYKLWAEYFVCSDLAALLRQWTYVVQSPHAVTAEEWEVENLWRELIAKLGKKSATVARVQP